MESEPRPRMLMPEELVEVHSRELKIDLEKEHFEELNVQLSSSDDEDQNKAEPEPKVVQRQVKLQTREIPSLAPKGEPAQAAAPAQPKQAPQTKTTNANNNASSEKKTSPLVYAAIVGAVAVIGFLFVRIL